MTYDTRKLSVLAYANGFTLWHYSLGDEHVYLEFPPGDMLRAGDLVIASSTRSFYITHVRNET
jgi:hypothetical protein